MCTRVAQIDVAALELAFRAPIPIAGPLHAFMNQPLSMMSMTTSDRPAS